MFILSGLQVYVFKNKFALKIHLGDCNYPSEIEDIQIMNRLGPISIFTKSDGYSEATFFLDQKYLKPWLYNSNFEVLSYLDDTSESRQFRLDTSKIPIDIVNGNMNFSFQILHANDERTVINVEKANHTGRVKVNLRYCAT